MHEMFDFWGMYSVRKEANLEPCEKITFLTKGRWTVAEVWFKAVRKLRYQFSLLPTTLLPRPFVEDHSFDRRYHIEFNLKLLTFLKLQDEIYCI